MELVTTLEIIKWDKKYPTLFYEKQHLCMKTKWQATCKFQIKIPYLHFYNMACLQKKKRQRQ